MLPQNIVVMVPHSDDEILAAGGVISRAVKERKKISVAIVTNGDYLCTTMEKGSIRLQESLSALRFLGMQEKDIYFLGYPDTGMEPSKSFLYRMMMEKDGSKKYPSPASSVTYGIMDGKQDYHKERTGEHALYCRTSLEQDINALLRAVRPELVITTSAYDCHGDHSGLSYFAEQALREVKQEIGLVPVLWEALIHANEQDDRWPLSGEADSMFTMPAIPENPEKETLSWWENRVRIPLLQDDIRVERKRKALLHYRSVLSQEEPEIVKYLLSFAKGEEIFFRKLV